MISKKHKKVCLTLNYIKNLLILASVVTGCVYLSAFTSLVGITVCIGSSVVALKIYAWLQELKSTSQWFRKKQHKIVFLYIMSLNNNSNYYIFFFFFSWKHQILYLYRIKVSDVDVNKTSVSEKSDTCHYWYFVDKGFKLHLNVRNGCYGVIMMSEHLSNIATLKI